MNSQEFRAICKFNMWVDCDCNMQCCYRCGWNPEIEYKRKQALKSKIKEEERKSAMKVKIDRGAFIPTRAHETDAGLDLKAVESQIVPARVSAVFKTGVHVKLPQGTAGILISKSGLNVKHDLTSTGLIDEGYTGEIMVKLYNHGSYDYKVEAGDKISQLVIVPIYREALEPVETLEESERGDDGFGSSGR